MTDTQASQNSLQESNADTSTASTDTTGIRVAFVDDTTGVGAFATHSYEPGECVLRERPYVFAQSYRTWNTHPVTCSDKGTDACAPTNTTTTPSTLVRLDALQRVRCCFGCGAPLLRFLKEECERLDDIAAQAREDSAEEVTVSDKDERVAAAASMWELIHATNTISYVNEHTHGTPSCHESDDEVREMYVSEVDVTGAVQAVYFCSSRCKTRALADDGKRFVLMQYSARGSNCGSGFWTAASLTRSCGEGAFSESATMKLRYPTYESIVTCAQHPPSAATRQSVWPTRLSVLSTLHSVARRCNERVWLLVLILAKELHQTLSTCTSPPNSGEDGAGGDTTFIWLERCVAEKFRARLDALCDRYAEGAMQLLTAEQRALLRFSWQLITWWWVLCCAEEQGVRIDSSKAVALHADNHERKNFIGAATLLNSQPALYHVSEQWWTDALRVAEVVAFPLQQYLQLYWLTNANVHMYVVASPLYTLWGRWLADVDHHHHNPMQRQQQRPSHSAPNDAQKFEVGEDHQADKTALFYRLFDLFHGSNVWAAKLQTTTASSGTPSSNSSASTSDVLHATGVALYDVATKLNHSCVPTVCFQPNTGAVEASMVAVCPIAAGAELFTSYVRPDQFEPVHGENDGDCGCEDGGGGREGCCCQRTAARCRRRYLEAHYGFVCCCPLCAALDD